MSLFKTLIMVFFIGLIFLSIGDINHLDTDTTWYGKVSYNLPYIFNIPFWVPIQFGFASVFFYLVYLKLKNILVLEKTPSLLKVNFFGSLFFISYLASGWIGPEYGIGKTLAFYLLAFMTSFKYFDLKEYWPEIVFILFVVIVGCSYEMTLSNLKIFGYKAPQDTLNGVATWLPVLYFFAARAVIEMVTFFVARRFR